MSSHSLFVKILGILAVGFILLSLLAPVAAILGPQSLVQKQVTEKK